MSKEDNINSANEIVAKFANHIVHEAVKEGLDPQELLDSTLALLISMLSTARDKGNVDIENVSVSTGVDRLTVTLEKIGTLQ